MKMKWDILMIFIEWYRDIVLVKTEAFIETLKTINYEDQLVFDYRKSYSQFH
jgi:hypothetical protein